MTTRRPKPRAPKYPEWIEIRRSPMAVHERAPIVGREIKVPGNVAAWACEQCAGLDVERVWVLHLNAQNRVTSASLISQGILDNALMHPREVFRAAVVTAAAGLIIIHNHPSGVTTPSAEDGAITRQLVEAGRLLDIPVYDHLIVGHDQDGAPRWFSFAEAGLI